VAGILEHGIQNSGPIKREEFFDYLRDCQLIKEDSSPWS